MIPYTDFGGNGPELLFLHANGYPPACYLPLLDMLKERYHVTAMHQRPLWPHAAPKELRDWHPLSSDFLQFLEERQIKKAIVIGHSMGGIVALRAALRHPDRFEGLILLDPVLFAPGFIVLWNLVRMLGLGWRLHPLIPTAQKRRRVFDDLERVFASYRRRPIFRYMDDTALRNYILGLTHPSPQGGYQLRYSPEWETRIYYTSVWRDFDLWHGLPHLQRPALILRGAETDTFLPFTAFLVRRFNPRIQIETLSNTTHLLPLEAPQKVAEHIRLFFPPSLPPGNRIIR